MYLYIYEDDRIEYSFTKPNEADEAQEAHGVVTIICIPPASQVPMFHETSERVPKHTFYTMNGEVEDGG